MYFGYTLIKDSLNGDKVELCMLPEKPGSFPIPIHSLPFTDAAVCFISQEEAIIVSPGEESAIVLTAQKPGKIYLTPNRPEKPGFSVSKVKVIKISEGKMKCQYDREKGWEDFTPNSREY